MTAFPFFIVLQLVQNMEFCVKWLNDCFKNMTSSLLCLFILRDA